MRDRKGVNPDGSRGEELGEADRGETIIRIIIFKKYIFSIKKKPNE